MSFILQLIVVLIQLLVVLNASSQNPLCNNTNITIDSAFVDKYTDLGSDVITLFSDTTVHQLTIDSNETIQYNRSIPLNEWSTGIVGPINCSSYRERGSIISTENMGLKVKWDLWPHNKTIKDRFNVSKSDCNGIVFEKLVMQPFEWKRSAMYSEPDFPIVSNNSIHGSNAFSHNVMYLIPILKKNKNNNKSLTDKIESYLSQTTAGFAFNDYFYFIAGNRVCRMDNRTYQLADNCLTQTIAQWIGCEGMDKTVGTGYPWLVIIIISVTIIIILMTALMACLMNRVMTEEEKDITSKQKVYPKYKLVDPNVDTVPKGQSTTSLSSASSDNRPTELAVKRSSVKSMK